MNSEHGGHVPHSNSLSIHFEIMPKFQFSAFDSKCSDELVNTGQYIYYLVIIGGVIVSDGRDMMALLPLRTICITMQIASKNEYKLICSMEKMSLL